MVFQLGSALLDACVLAIVAKEDVYGYKLTQEVKEIMNISESTLYPVLRRLTKEGYLSIYDQQHMGRNRRYYSITEKGKDQTQFYQDAWVEFAGKIDKILKGGENHE